MFAGIMALIFPVIIIVFIGWFISKINMIEDTLCSIDRSLKLIAEHLQRNDI